MRMYDRLSVSYTSPATQWLSSLRDITSYFFWINKHAIVNAQRPISGMFTSRPQNLQLPIQPRTLLIAKVTKLQPFITRGTNFRESIEALVSYNIRNGSAQQDCLYIEQGHLMTPTTFMSHSMAVDPRKSVVVTWTPVQLSSTLQQGSLPLYPQGSPLFTSSWKCANTFLMPYPTKPKGGWQRPRQIVVNKNTAQIRERKATNKFVNKYRKVFQNSMAEGHNDPQGPFFYQEGGKTYASLPLEMLHGI